MIIVSACLAGINCNYKGSSIQNKKIIQLISEGKAIPICPEQLGGQTTPRPYSAIDNGSGEDVLNGNAKVIQPNSKDETQQHIVGAQEVLKIAKLVNAKIAILKQRSPSCGCGQIRNHPIEKKLVQGNGVTTALLKRNGIIVYSENDLEDNETWKAIKNQ
jgi:uncharacterized protein YbbK (DUF523 family)